MGHRRLKVAIKSRGGGHKAANGVPCMMNNEQIKSIVRWGLASVSSFVSGFLLAKRWFSPEETSQISALFSSEAVVAIVTALISGGWGLIAHTQKNTIAATDAIPEVKKVELKPTEAGKALAKAVASPTVIVAP
jgi:hypothetical protein